MIRAGGCGNSPDVTGGSFVNETRVFSLVPLRPDAPGTQPARLHSDYRSSINRAPLQPLVPIPQTL
ncbi:MAG: hypothetical protein ACREQ5_09905, partial [Candidatus Dormibacteria bacterium]